MLAGWVLVLAGGMLLWSRAGDLEQAKILQEYFPGAYSVLSRLAFLVLAGVMAVALGTFDDVRHLKAHWKFLGQLIVALIAVWGGGIRITLFVAAPWFGFAVTVFWFMMLMNAINFFDNLDGLAAGTAAIALILFTVAAGFQQQYFTAALSALGAGCAVGFWFYNYAPASIFMGDGGSHFLGYLLAPGSGSPRLVKDYDGPSSPNTG